MQKNTITVSISVLNYFSQTSNILPALQIIIRVAFTVQQTVLPWQYHLLICKCLSDGGLQRSKHSESLLNAI
jgi:hypothetical protein